MTWFHDLPKIELHIHLEGAIPHQALFDLIQKYGGHDSIPNVAALVRRFEYRDFAHFIDTWSWKNQFLCEYDDFTHIAELTARDLAAQNIRYAEMFFSPSLFVRHGLEVQELTRAVRRGLSRVSQIEIALVADLVRDYGPHTETATLHALNEVRDAGVIGIGIGGTEHEFPPEPFESLFEKARQMGFRTNAHAGEAAGPESVWGAIRSLRVERIGHGTRIHEDPQLLNHVAERGIPIELCPISNVRTGIVPNIAEHPIRRYFDLGLMISVNTDDPKMFNTSLADEYRALVEACGFSRDEIRELVLRSIRSSWLPENKQDALAAELGRFPA